MPDFGIPKQALHKASADKRSLVNSGWRDPELTDTVWDDVYQNGLLDVLYTGGHGND